MDVEVTVAVLVRVTRDVSVVREVEVVYEVEVVRIVDVDVTTLLTYKVDVEEQIPVV
jgi:hypothetical protein